MSKSKSHPSRARAVGIIEVLLSGFCFGFLGIFGKSAFAKGVTPGELLSLRFTLAGFLVFAYIAATSPRRLRIGWSKVAWSCALGCLGYAVFSFFYFQALSGLSASLAVLLLYMFPVMVAVGAWIFLGEKIPKERWFVLPVAMMGLVLLIWGDIQVRSAVSIAFGLGAAFFYSIYILCSSRFLAGVDPLVAAAFMQLAAGLTLGALNWRDPQRIAAVAHDAWLPLLGLALICSIAAMSLFLQGLQKLKNWEVSILSTAEPVTNITIAYLFLHERLSPAQLLGGGMVLVAFVAVSLPSRPRGEAHV